MRAVTLGRGLREIRETLRKIRRQRIDMVGQAEMADVLGLSVVHMNRVIQSLRREDLISWTHHTISILDWVRLQEVAEFDPTYLSMVREPR